MGWDVRESPRQVNSVSQVDEDLDMVPTYWLSVERAQQMNNGLCQHFCLGEDYSSTSHPDAKQFSSSLYVPDTLRAATPMLELRASLYETL